MDDLAYWLRIVTIFQSPEEIHLAAAVPVMGYSTNQRLAESVFLDQFLKVIYFQVFSLRVMPMVFPLAIIPISQQTETFYVFCCISCISNLCNRHISNTELGGITRFWLPECAPGPGEQGLLDPSRSVFLQISINHLFPLMNSLSCPENFQEREREREFMEQHFSGSTFNSAIISKRPVEWFCMFSIKHYNRMAWIREKNTHAQFPIEKQMTPNQSSCHVILKSKLNACLGYMPGHLRMLEFIGQLACGCFQTSSTCLSMQGSTLSLGD